MFRTGFKTGVRRAWSQRLPAATLAAQAGKVLTAAVFSTTKGTKDTKVRTDWGFQFQASAFRGPQDHGVV